MFPAIVAVAVHSPEFGFTIINKSVLVVGPLLSPNLFKSQDIARVFDVVVTVIDAPVPLLI